MISTVEVEETVALRDYKTIRIRICLQDEEMGAEELGDEARKVVKSQIRKLLKTVNAKNLSGGLSHQWAYKNGRRKKDDS